jgi:hypothetical protein
MKTPGRSQEEAATLDLVDTRDADTAPGRRTPAWGAAMPIWIMIAVCAVTAVTTKLILGLALDPFDIGVVIAITLVMLSISAFYTFKRANERIARLYRAVAELFLLTILVGSLSYGATSLNRPLWDDVFLAWDLALGFDWKYWLAFLDALPTINRLLVYAYHSMWPQLALLLIALVSIQNYRRLDVLLLSFGFSAVVTVIIAGIMPALSPLAYLQITPQDHPHITLAVPREFEAQALALRAGTMRVIELGGAQGLVTFPSFHTVTAVLLMLGFWAVPYLRWVSLGLNTVMLVSIPIEGSHYLVDVLAGIAVAWPAWIIAQSIVTRMETSRMTRASVRHPSFALP